MYMYLEALEIPKTYCYNDIKYIIVRQISYDHLYGSKYDLISEFAETLSRERVNITDYDKSVKKN